MHLLSKLPDVHHLPLLKQEGNWDKLTVAKASGTVTGDRKKNWPIADWHVYSDNPRSPCKS